MVVGAAMAAGTAAATGSSGATLYGYNRKNFLYDRKMRQEAEYQIMEFKIKKGGLFREDISDIVDLTLVKMDTYMLVNAIMLGFCMMLFAEGQLSAETPKWLIGCHTLSLAGAFMYILMSVWLSMHATVASKSYKARLLTQLVRLPVPSWAQIEGARTFASAFEKTETRQMFRVPFAMGTQESVLHDVHGGAGNRIHGDHTVHDDGTKGHTDKGDADDLDGVAAAADSGGDDAAYAADPWGLERPGEDIYELDESAKADPRHLRHIELVRRAAQYWQSYDAFSRVAMTMGSMQLVTTLVYYVLAYVVVTHHAIIAALLTIVLFLSIICGLIRLDMSLTVVEYRVSVLLVLTGPVCMAFSTVSWTQHGTSLLIKVLMPIAYASHACWFMFILYLTKIGQTRSGVQLPQGFRSVMFVDIWGWISDNFTAKTLDSIGHRHGLLPEPPRLHAAGPAVQSVRYEDGQPIPMRIEQLPGASRAPRDPDTTRADFAPSTFVPRERGEAEEADGLASVEAAKAGSRPWKVFCGATALLAALFWLSGLLITMDLFGVHNLNVVPLLKDPYATPKNDTNFLEFGRALPTSWPNAYVRAFGLACNGASPSIVAMSRYGLYTADLGDASKSGRVRFQAAPGCRDIAGERLEDVSLVCGSEKGACQAAVLHQRGQRLSRCDVAKQKGAKLQAKSVSQSPSVALVAADWLNDGDALGKGAAESVQSVAFTSQCVPGGAQECAYVGTSSGRLVKMRQAADRRVTHKWFPQQQLSQKLNATASGKMDVIHGRYLGLLQRDGRHLDVLDLEKGGTLVDSWRLPHPAEDHAWTSMCAAGDDLYFLSEGRSPQLWRFAVPRKLQPESTAKPPQQHATRDARARPTLLSMSAHRNRQEGASHVSLGLSPDGSVGPGLRHALRR